MNDCDVEVLAVHRIVLGVSKSLPDALTDVMVIVLPSQLTGGENLICILSPVLRPTKNICASVTFPE